MSKLSFVFIGSYCVPSYLETRINDAKDLTFVPQMDDMKARVVYLDAQKGLWFYPSTKMDEKGRQYGFLLDNPYGIAVKKTWEVEE